MLPRFYTAASPLIVDKMCILPLGGNGKGSVVALDLASGETKWKTDGDGITYSSPVVMSVDGANQIVQVTEKSVEGLSAADGKLLWQAPYGGGGMRGGRGMRNGPGGGGGPGGPGGLASSCTRRRTDHRARRRIGRPRTRTRRSSPGRTRRHARWNARRRNELQRTNPRHRRPDCHPHRRRKRNPRLKIEKNGDAYAATALWTNATVSATYNTPVVKDGKLYGVSGKGTLFCLDAQTGKTLWEDTTSRAQRRLRHARRRRPRPHRHGR